MGGAIRRVFRSVFSPPAYTPPPAQMVSAGPVSPRSIYKGGGAVRGQGSGVTGTIMTSAEGLEEEANVSKTALGGTTTKKKKYKV